MESLDFLLSLGEALFRKSGFRLHASSEILAFGCLEPVKFCGVFLTKQGPGFTRDLLCVESQGFFTKTILSGQELHRLQQFLGQYLKHTWPQLFLYKRLQGRAVGNV